MSHGTLVETWSNDNPPVRVLVEPGQLQSYVAQGYTQTPPKGTTDPEVAYTLAGNNAFKKALSEGKSEEDAGAIARKAAHEAKRAAWEAAKNSDAPDGETPDANKGIEVRREVGLNGDAQAIKDDQNQPPVGRAANNETGAKGDKSAKGETKPSAKSEAKADDAKK